MATSTQYNPQVELNKVLLSAGVSKTVYALVTPETEATKAVAFGDAGSAEREEYLDQFRDAWTGKQDRFHEEFFETWAEWSKPMVDLDRKLFPFFYPTAGASEPLRHLIYEFAARRYKQGALEPFIHVFEGEYEGYKAMAEAAGLEVIEHDRADWENVADIMGRADDNHLFFLSQPSAIDGNIWEDAPKFLAKISEHMAWSQWPVDPRVVMDLTYVGAVADVKMKFNMNEPCVRNVVFSLSKPFGTYYDRIGGVFCRWEDAGLFGNKWFKGLTGLRIGTLMMQRHHVFELPRKYLHYQHLAAAHASKALGFEFTPADVYLLATAPAGGDLPMANYLRRAGKLRVCVTPAMAKMIAENA
jgi:hypothetical protein